MISMDFVFLALLVGTACATSPPTMRKEAKTAMAVDSSGVIENVSPRKHMRKVRGDEHGAIVVESSGAVYSMPQDLENTAGPVADALHNAKAELGNQIQEITKAKADTDLLIDRTTQDKEQKQKELAKALEAYQFWIKKHAALQAEIEKLSGSIAHLTNLSSSQQAEINRLKKAHQEKHNAAMMAEDLEKLIISLTAQIKEKEKLEVDTEADHRQIAAKQKQNCDAAVQKYTDSIANLTSAINEAQAELDLLTEKHTTVYCEEKEAKNENICKRCSTGEPCGDTCISASKTCYHDPGCACKPSPTIGSTGNTSLLEAKPSGDDDAHPLQTKLRNAKAALRKIIAQHQDTIDGLEKDITANEQKQASLQKEKERAIEDFDKSLNTLANQKAQLVNSSDVAKANKAQAHKDLHEAISSGTAAIAKLEKELKDSISDLKAERTREEDARATQITTCGEDMKALLDSQGNVISAIRAGISQLKQQLADAQNQLNKLKKQHGVTDADSPVTISPIVGKPTDAPVTISPIEKQK